MPLSYAVFEIDLLEKLEENTNHNENFDFIGWAPGHTDRLRKIVEFLEDQERIEHKCPYCKKFHDPRIACPEYTKHLSRK